MPVRQIADCFVKGIISLGEVERQIPFIHAGRKRKFTVNSLFPGQNLHIWAEFGDFCIEFEKFTVNFPVLVIRIKLQVEIGLGPRTLIPPAMSKPVEPVLLDTPVRRWLERPRPRVPARR
jgi:hypothetical protein